MQAVGPGWWDLLRDAFAEAEARNSVVYGVEQKFGTLRVTARGPSGWLTELEARCEAASAITCEVCGGPATTSRGPTIRTHCQDCAQRWRDLHWDERELWMEAAGIWLPEWPTL